MTRTPSMSVVVPTRDRPTALAACLASLAAQGVESFEVIVVDDKSADADAVAAVVAAATTEVRLVRGVGRGPAAARNLGAANARGAVISFTDDDCQPIPGWLDALESRTSGGADVVVGPTRVANPGDVVANASQTITNHLVEASMDPAGGEVGFAPTSNLACRAALHRAFPFDEDYPLAAGEDREWCRRITASGVAITYEPGAVVEHHPDLSVRGFWRQQVRYGRGARRFHENGTSERRLQPIGFYTGLVRKGFARGVRVGSLVVLAQVATAVGVGWGLLADRRR
jgi:glycosyltransferase involved in cell wall biosynthesis